MSTAIRRMVVPCLMVTAWALAPGTRAASASTVVQQEQAAGGLEVTLLRTWAPEDLTVVDGLANVPLTMLAGGTTGAYRFELSVFDATDTQLYRDSWERQVSRQAAAYVESGTSYLLEPFRFGVRPGEYEVEIRAYPTDAPDLGERVEGEGPLDTEEAASFGADIAAALGAAHRQGVLHRDVKPQNLLIDAYGQVKLCDFGIAAMARSDEFQARTSAVSTPRSSNTTNSSKPSPSRSAVAMTANSGRDNRRSA